MPRSSRVPTHSGTSAGPPGASLSPAEFAERFEAAAGILGTLAAGVLADRSRAEDVLQEACVIALQKLQQFRTETSFTAWMGRIVRFVALNHLRSQIRRRVVGDENEFAEHFASPKVRELELPVGEGGQLTGDQGHFDDELVQAMGELRPTARACLLLKVVSELEYAQIGRVLGIPEGTAMSHVHRARRALRERLERDSGTSRAMGEAT